MSPLPDLKPGDLPVPMSRSMRRRLAAQDPDGDYSRPNIDPNEPTGYDRCLDSKYQTHRFVVSTRERKLVCEFCGRHEPTCREPK